MISHCLSIFICFFFFSIFACFLLLFYFFIEQKLCLSKFSLPSHPHIAVLYLYFSSPWIIIIITTIHVRRARNGPDCWVLEAKNQNALISISFVSQIQSFYHSLQLIHSSSKLKNRRGQDERHCLFDVCSVGRLVVLSLSMSLLILNH